MLPCAGKWRSRLTIWLLAAIWIVLAGRLVFLQWIGSAQLAEKANRQRTYVQAISARPGDIVDRDGRLLATTVNADSLFVVPEQIAKPDQIATALAEALNLDRQSLLNRLLTRRRKKFLWIKRRLEEDEAAVVRRLNIPPQTWGFRKEYLRRYPQGSLASHVIGLRDIDGVGHGGIEEHYDELIRGRDGRRVLVRDARGRVIDVNDDHDELPQHGRTVRLTLNAVIQLYAERELDAVMSQWQPRTACAIVLDSRTGDVLAMASRPTFNPNQPVNVADDAWTNTAIASMYEPGSTFKPFVVAWALETGRIRPTDRFDCEQGAYKMGGRVLHDDHPQGWLDIGGILVKSSNIGMAKIGERLGNEGLFNAAIAFGFGRETGCGLPGELAGSVRPLDGWNAYSTGSVPMGQEIAVTPLQLLTAFAALSNSGLLMTPRLVSKHIAPPPFDDVETTNTSSRDTVVSRTVSPATARWIVEGPLRDAVQFGTGQAAELSDYMVFGKTGTAQKIDPSTGAYSSEHHVSSFVCGAPANDPRVVVAVIVDDPSVGRTHYGGRVAAPAAGRLLRKVLIHQRVPADREPLRAARR
jgi:cell division protein FtsI/penicillin-binding protein 2